MYTDRPERAAANKTAKRHDGSTKSQSERPTESKEPDGQFTEANMESGRKSAQNDSIKSLRVFYVVCRAA